MKILLATITLLMTCTIHAQNHGAEMSEINTVEEAQAYASKFREVSFSIVNYEKDRMLFDGIDTSNLQNHTGQSKSIFGRTTKFIKDTLFHMVEVQIIQFDKKSTSPEIRSLLLKQIDKRLKNGETYWDIKKKFGHTSADFWSGPEYTNTIASKYQLNLETAEKGQVFEIILEEENMGFLILKKVTHEVPAYYSIAYTNR